MILLLACTGPDDVPKGDDTSPPIETGVIDDSEETAIDSEETGTTEPVSLVALEVSPVTLTVNPGAVFAVRAVATDSLGEVADADPTWASDDPAVATVDAGAVTAVAAGTTTIRATLEGLEATLTLTVDEALYAYVTVVETTGAPIDGARVAIPFTEAVYTDETGVAALPVPDAGPLTFSAWIDEDHDAVTIGGAVGRRFVVPLAATVDPVTMLHGTVDFSSVDDAAFDEAVIGLVAPTIQGTLATLDLDTWFAPDRTISFAGIDADVPSNLVVEGSAEDYYSPVRPGSAGAWILTGPISYADIAASVGSAQEAIALLVDHLDVMRWGWTGAVEAGSGLTTDAPLAPGEPLTETLVVAPPSLPEGFIGTEEVLVLTAEQAEAGWVVNGLGIGAGAFEVNHTGTAEGVVIYAQSGGLGGAGGISVAEAEVTMQGLPSIVTWDPASRALAVDVDTRADFVHLLMTDNHQLRHHYYLSGDWTGEAPTTLTSFGRASARLDLTGVETVRGSFEARVAEGDVVPHTFPVRTRAHITQE